MSILIESFNTIFKVAEGIVSVQDTIITMCLPESNEKKQQLVNSINKVKQSKRKLEAKRDKDKSMINRSNNSKRKLEHNNIK